MDMTSTINGLPVYEALVDDEYTGILRVSLVDDPAIMSDFQAFANAKPLAFRISDEEKRLVFGCVMRADFPIYRRDAAGEYYILYKADTIRRMAEKYLAEARQNNVDLMHSGFEVQGVQMVMWLIKDTARGIAPEGFDDIADGSLFAEYHVTDDAIWEQVKAGTFKGFSLEGVFELEPDKDQEAIDETVKELDGKFNNHNHKQMSKLAKFKAALAKALMQLANVTTDKGVLSWDTEDDLKAGDEVFIENEDGTKEPAADGDYTTEDGKVIRVADGKVVEIVDQEAEVAPEPEAEEQYGRVDTDKGALIWAGEEDLKEGDDVFVEAEDGNLAPAPDGDYAIEDAKVIVVVDGKVAEIRDAKAEVAPEPEQEPSPVEEELSRLREEVEKLSRQVAELAATPMKASAHEEVTTGNPMKRTGVKGLDKLANYMKR